MAYIGQVKSMWSANYQAMPGTTAVFSVLLVLGAWKAAWFSKNLYKYKSFYPPAGLV